MGATYKRVGWLGKLKRVLPAIRAQTVVLCFHYVTEMHTIYRIGQDGHWQRFDTTLILISAPQFPHRPCNAPTRPYRVGKKKQTWLSIATSLIFLDST